MLVFIAMQAQAVGFVRLPQEGFADSAYIPCNTTGDFGRGISTQPTTEFNNDCAVFLRNAAKAPLSGYDLQVMKMHVVSMPAPHAGADNNVGSVTDLVWRKTDTGECIYGTFVHVNATVLANGQYWEVNDVVRGGFAGKVVDAAYLFAFHPKGVRSTESVFRIGRTFTSVRHASGDVDLPPKAGAADTVISSMQTAAVNDNWIDFTTDLNQHDPDGSSFPDSSLMYVKTACTADTPVEVDGAIRLRTTGQNGQEALEVRVPGYVPAGARIDAK